jgi:hypothetical protein
VAPSLRRSRLLPYREAGGGKWKGQATLTWRAPLVNEAWGGGVARAGLREGDGFRGWG